MKAETRIESDKQSEKAKNYSHLDWVGMTQIQTSIQLVDFQQITLTAPALLDVGVDLSENNRGIHMSRLYQLHQELILNQSISNLNFSNFAQACLHSQLGLSQFFAAKIKFTLPKVTQSLASNLSGYRNYPIEIIFEKNQSSERAWVQFEVLYSSTCPQSASLSMEVLKNNKQSLERLPATPHAQRSRARVRLEVQKFDQKQIEFLIDLVESSLGTPVQTTVKKVDEMKFAELNAENLMFCEDAARKIAEALKQSSILKSWSIYCEHQESLHPHNASSISLNLFQGPSRLEFG